MEQQLISIQNLIYDIRDRNVMLDFDLASMYGIETKRLKEAVRRNIKRFEGDDFMFQLSKDEVLTLSRFKIGTLNEPSRSQIATLNTGRGSNIKYAPFAFTELGVAMLSSVLNSDVAIEVNRNIMRAFVFVRQLIYKQPTDKVTKLQIELTQLKTYIEEVFTDYNNINEDTRQQLEIINQTLAEMQIQKHLPNRPRLKIGYFTEEQIKKGENIIE